MELVVRQDDHRNRRVAQVVRDIKHEAIIVDEDGVQIPIEELAGDRALELIVAEIEEFERWEAEHDVRELPDKAIVAEIKLKKELQLIERARDNAAEPIGVDMEECEVG